MMGSLIACQKKSDDLNINDFVYNVKLFEYGLSKKIDGLIDEQYVIKLGDVELWKYIFESELISLTKLYPNYEVKAYCHNIELIKYLEQKSEQQYGHINQQTLTYICEDAAKENNFDVFEMIYPELQPFHRKYLGIDCYKLYDTIFAYAVIYGRLDIIQKLIKHINKPTVNRMSNKAALYNQPHIIDYLFDNKLLFITDELLICCIYGCNIELFEKLYKNYETFEMPTRILDILIDISMIEIVYPMIVTRYKFLDIYRKNKEIIEMGTYLLSKGYKFSSKSYIAIIDLYNLEILEWAVNNGCQITNQKIAFECAIDSKKKDIVYWLYEKYGDLVIANNDNDNNNDNGNDNNNNDNNINDNNKIINDKINDKINELADELSNKYKIINDKIDDLINNNNNSNNIINNQINDLDNNNKMIISK